MGVRFEVDVKSCAAGFVAGSLQSQDLSVFHAGVGVSSSADNVAVGVCDNRADAGIRRGQADALVREFQCAMTKRFVQRVSGHAKRIYHEGTAADCLTDSPTLKEISWSSLRGVILSGAVLQAKRRISGSCAA